MKTFGEMPVVRIGGWKLTSKGPVTIGTNLSQGVPRRGCI